MIKDKKVLVVIPARLGGYRFPDKPIRKICEKPMIEWVWANAINSKYADKVVIATPDKEIQKISSVFGAETMLTVGNHLRGTERVNEVYEKLNREYEIVVNFQGDEPLVSSEYLDLTIEVLEEDTSVDCVNLYRLISYEEAEKDQNEVKVVTDYKNIAMYFSRNALPAKWLGDKTFDCKAEICVMPMWADSLEKFVNTKNSYYENIESVDMMRFVENGYKVKMVECKDEVKSVDCQADLEEAEKILKKNLNKS
jgi:3-deoxy-manno-octulosonate cytidylyltransferase (CMP-KDO synthetase)